MGLRQVCVFCGSSLGASPEFVDAAIAVATELADAGLGVIYGGGNRGLMGVVADTVMARGGSVTGVLPRVLFDIEVPKLGLTSLIEVDSMHERKQQMYSLADGFVGLPGGLGTLEEVAEIATWAQLGLHSKPIVLVDTEGFWRPLLGWLDAAVAAGFVKPANRGIIASVSSPADVIPALLAASLPGTSPGLRLSET